MAEEFPDGVWVFELAAVADPAAVPDAVAAVMGITQQPGKTVGESVAAALEGRSRFLLFDNCEHIVDAAADLIETIRSHSASVKILATSREGLGVEDERLWRVPSLEVGAAVELFEQRAESLSGGRVDGGGGDLSSSRRDPVGDRAGGVADGVNDRGRGPGSSRSPIQAVGRDHGAVWSATRHCATRWRGHTTCWAMTRRRCWSGARCSPAGLIFKAPAL